MKKSLFIVSIFISAITYAQVPTAEELVRAHNVTTADRNSITSLQPGMLIFDTDQDRLYEYTTSGWVEILTGRNVYVGAFQITAAGNVSVTGMPFQPSSVTFTAYANVESFDLNSDNGVGNNNTGIANSFGYMTGFARDDGGAIAEQVIYGGGSGNSINDISRYASSSHSIGLRYGNQDGNSLGLTTATMTSFNTDGFTLNVDSFADGVVVIFTAHK